jgi:hypothetical protein
MATKIEDQPAPVASTSTPAWELVIRYVNDNYEADDVLADMRERDKLGRERYGKPLAANNGRKHLVDCYQELLDGVVYLCAYLDERGIDPDGMRQATNKRELTKADELALGLFKDQIEALIDLREVL